MPIVQFDMFESLVNTEGFQTNDANVPCRTLFESLVNTEGFQTKSDSACADDQFESLVNTEGFQTRYSRNNRC